VTGASDSQLLAAETLASLNGQADVVRIELTLLRRRLSEVKEEIDNQHSVQLLEANEHLVVAALHANTIADAAVASASDGRSHAAEMLESLNGQADVVRIELTLLRRRLSEMKQDIGSQRNVQLLEANEHLVSAALHANTIADTAVKTIADMVTMGQRDPLTNTPNRALTLERLDTAIALAKRHAASLAVLFVDVDNLKTINDTMGHAAGDSALQLTARRLESVVRVTDTVSRHGGDEFVVLLAEISQPSEAAAIASTMLHSLSLPTQIGEHVVSLHASIGVALYPEDGTTAATLIASADAAMYVAKRRGGSGFFLRDPALPNDPRLELSGQEVVLHPVMAEVIATTEHSPMADLRDANERLVIAALTAQELKTLAEEAHGRQIKFMAMVAHELRNPLTPIRMAAGLLNLSGTDEARLVRLQGIIESQVTHLARLVDDLLDGSRITTGKLRLECRAVELAEILTLARETCQPAMQARKQHLDVDVPPTPVMTQADPVRLTQVFSNLLDNASKYTPAHGHISLSLVTQGNEAIVTVTDNGIGITAEALPHIFDLFMQDAGALTLHSGGLGIGLAVVRELVEAHNGSVVVRSDGRDKGSTFVVTLPLAHATRG
jgi:diguanylate cyclase (GGDEF)-like protein